ncbi:MAG: glutamyl-tRNA reductase [Bacteroidetes bacterium]|nr:MAG: glutamyl-tRNA reductase [Bacteroidota bacterium]
MQEFSEYLKNEADFKSLIILSTCNRTEIYFYCQKTNNQEGFDLILRALSKYKGYTETMKPYFYFKSGREAVEHLFKVSSGIDSLIIGEDQIIGQVKNAFTIAQEIKSTDSILTRLFTKAFEAGKRVRSETKINQGSGSVSSAAVDLCHKYYPDLSKHSILIIGAGQTGQLVLTGLSKHNIKSLYIANRTVSKAEELAIRYNGKAIELESIEQYLAKSDIIIVATDSKNHLITKEMVLKTCQENNSIQKQLYIDLSVPRNIEKFVNELSNKQLYAVDDLTEIVNSTTLKRQNAVSEAIKIINEVSTDYMEWLVVRGLSPIFSKIKKNFQQVHEKELQGFKKVNILGDHKVLEDYGKHISEKYSRLFIKNLREIVKDGEKKEYIEAINELFEM